MANTHNPNDKRTDDRTQTLPKSSPSGATDRPLEREKNFEAEGGGQRQGQTPPSREKTAKDKDPRRTR